MKTGAKAVNGRLTLKNAGPIQGVFQADVSQGAGLYTLTGAKATGKSTVLRSLQLLQGHSVEITIHDGELDGYISGWGVVVPLGPRRRPSGELELDALEGATFTDFLCPQGKTAATRDKVSIQALIRLTGVQANESDYYELVGGKDGFDRLAVAATEDPLVLAKRVKTKLEERARDLERQSQSESSHAAALANTDGLDMDATSDLNLLMVNRDAAKATLNQLIAAAERAAENEKEIEVNRLRLARHHETYKGKSVEEATEKACSLAAAIHQKEASMAKLADEIASLTRNHELMQTELNRLRSECEHAIADRESAIQYRAAVAEWTASVARNTDKPDAATLEKAKQAVEDANEAYHLGIRVRDAQTRLKQSEIHREMSRKAQVESIKWRTAASQVFPILTSRLRTGEVEIEQVDDDARLVVRHPRRDKKVFFNEETDLSEGERIMIAIRELLPRVNRPGLFDVPQHVFAAIQPADRRALHEFAVENGIYLWGAIIDDGELTVRFGP